MYFSPKLKHNLLSALKQSATFQSHSVCPFPLCFGPNRSSEQKEEKGVASGSCLQLCLLVAIGSWTQLSDSTFTFHFHAVEKEMATHSSVLAWRIPGMGEPGGLPSMGSHRVGHD